MIVKGPTLITGVFDVSQVTLPYFLLHCLEGLLSLVPGNIVLGGM